MPLSETWRGRRPKRGWRNAYVEETPVFQKVIERRSVPRERRIVIDDIHPSTPRMKPRFREPFANLYVRRPGGCTNCCGGLPGQGPGSDRHGHVGERQCCCRAGNRDNTDGSYDLNYHDIERERNGLRNECPICRNEGRLRGGAYGSVDLEKRIHVSPTCQSTKPEVPFFNPLNQFPSSCEMTRRERSGDAMCEPPSTPTSRQCRPVKARGSATRISSLVNKPTFRSDVGVTKNQQAIQRGGDGGSASAQSRGTPCKRGGSPQPTIRYRSPKDPKAKLANNRDNESRSRRTEVDERTEYLRNPTRHFDDAVEAREDCAGGRILLESDEIGAMRLRGGGRCDSRDPARNFDGIEDRRFLEARGHRTAGHVLFEEEVDAERFRRRSEDRCETRDPTRYFDDVEDRTFADARRYRAESRVLREEEVEAERIRGGCGGGCCGSPPPRYYSAPQRVSFCSPCPESMIGSSTRNRRISCCCASPSHGSRSPYPRSDPCGDRNRRVTAKGCCPCGGCGGPACDENPGGGGAVGGCCGTASQRGLPCRCKCQSCKSFQPSGGCGGQSCGKIYSCAGSGGGTCCFPRNYKRRGGPECCGGGNSDCGGCC